MTHQNIYTKFLIEYDKANVTSSYPSFTEYEAATILDKAYLALISQKVTGNNARKAVFGEDSKTLSDLQPLIVTDNIASTEFDQDRTFINYPNEYGVPLPLNFLYFISAAAYYDTQNNIVENIILTQPQLAIKCGVTQHNDPILKNSVCFLSSDNMCVFYDKKAHSNLPNTVNIQYIKKPEKFYGTSGIDTNTFELNDSMAEELINLAVIIALENVESPRTNQKINVS